MQLTPKRIKQKIRKPSPSIYEKRKVILYLPTWGEHSSLDLYKNAIKELVQTEEYMIFLKPRIKTMKIEEYRLNYFQEETNEGKIICIDQDTDFSTLFSIANIVIVDATNEVFWESTLVSNLPTIVIHTENNRQKNNLEKKTNRFAIVNNNPKFLIKDIKRVEKSFSKLKVDEKVGR